MYGFSSSYYYPIFQIILVLAMAAAIVGGLLLYFLFVRKNRPYAGAAQKLHDLLSFRRFYTENLLRALYTITIVCIAVVSVVMLFRNIIGAIFFFVIGNLLARIAFELLLLTLVLCRNTQEINRKLGPLPAEPQAQTPTPQPQNPQVAVPISVPVPPQGQNPVPPAAPMQAQPPAPPAMPIPPQVQNPAPPAAPIPPQAQNPAPPTDGAL